MIGAAGFVAQRHMRAIKDTGNVLVAALDPCDSVGIIDSFFPQADFFTEFERFDRHVDLLRRKGKKIDYISICSPNYLHDAHIRFALRSGVHAICEKPLVLNPWNIDGLMEVEAECASRVYTILQLRLHPSLKKLKSELDRAGTDKKYEVDLTYITARGKWYLRSWKGDTAKSGGIATNIGIHFFDMLIWLFGKVQNHVVHKLSPVTASGFLELEKARIRWFLSVDAENLPSRVRESKQSFFRSITVNREEIEFSTGFADLHTLSYKEVLGGNGFSLADARPSIEVVSNIRNAGIDMGAGELHPFLKEQKIVSK
ncbi:MAG: Gfo/Idh/MocA family oxidoreductase [Desulfobacter sp.]|nr:MAG: Gfo/Idh/MocA family oxidoreductase [Desulfobacter sp.]